MSRVCDGKYTPILKSRSLPDLLATILKAFAFELDITLLDGDLTESEQAMLRMDAGQINSERSIPSHPRIIGYTQLIDVVQKSTEGCLTLYSSGTTGIPKPVSHKLGTLIRGVRQSERHQSDTWGLTYSPTHMAGIQVLLQASLNCNRIVNLRGLPREDVLDRIEVEQITHLSATTTFYRVLLPDNRILNSVKRITFGGERFDPHLIPDVKRMFPNAKIRNVYASTEVGTVFNSLNNEFVVEEGMAAQVRIEDQKLYLRKDLLGSFGQEDEWFDTGDHVAIISKKPLTFTFEHRASDIISVAGSNVNPHAVEDTLRSCPGIRDARVFGQRNSVIGTIIRAEVERSSQDCTEHEIRTFLESRLQSYKIPRIISFVDELERSHTGKVKR